MLCTSCRRDRDAVLGAFESAATGCLLLTTGIPTMLCGASVWIGNPEAARQDDQPILGLVCAFPGLVAVCLGAAILLRMETRIDT